MQHRDPDTVQPLKQRTCVPVEAWEPSVGTLVEDAVHAMSDALGIGANPARWDADHLTTRLLRVQADGADLAAVVGGFKGAMRALHFATLRRSTADGHRIIGHDELPVP